MESVDGSVSMKNTIFIVMIATYTVNTSGEIIRTILTPQPKQNQFIGKGGMNVYNNGVIHCDYIPYNACFTGMYCILPLFRWCCVLHFTLQLQQNEGFQPALKM